MFQNCYSLRNILTNWHAYVTFYILTQQISLRLTVSQGNTQSKQIIMEYGLGGAEKSPSSCWSQCSALPPSSSQAVNWGVGREVPRT